VSSGPRPTSVPSGILIYPDVSRLATIDIRRKLGMCPFFLGGGGREARSHLTQCRLSRRLPPYHLAVWQQYRHGPKIGGCAPCLRGSCVAIQHNVVWAEAYLGAMCHLDAFRRFATIDMGQKLGAVPLFGGREELGLHLAQCRLGQGLPPYQEAS